MERFESEFLHFFKRIVGKQGFPFSLHDSYFFIFYYNVERGMNHDIPQIKFTLFTFKEWFITKRTGLKIVYGPSDDIIRFDRC